MKIRPSVVRPGGGIGCLDGLAILRFAHAFETGGGVERYLEDLDRALLARNAITLVRVFLSSGRNQLMERTKSIGRGQVIQVPMPLPDGEGLELASDDEPSSTRLKHLIRDHVFYNPLVWRLWTKGYILRWRVPRRKGQPFGVGAKVADLIKRYPIKLIMLHFMGGADSDEIIRLAQSRGLPFAVQNHFSNDRFLHLSIRKHATLANGVAGVNGMGVPEYLRRRFRNLADGIDTEFLKREEVALKPDDLGPLAILLPARVVRTKGHLDLIKAATILRERNLDFQIAFAGRVDSSRFEHELRKEIGRCNLESRVKFLGALSQEELRDTYATSGLLAFPTYHHEGLPRVILEAQAMKVPPIAYAAGGVAEGLIPGKTGFLLRTGDVEGLANRLEELLRNQELRQRMGEEGRCFVEGRFSLEALARRHEEFYREILDSVSVPRS